MTEMLQWLVYTVIMSAIGVACLWGIWTQASAGVGEQVRTLSPPDGIVLEPTARHAIFEELLRRKRTGFRAAVVGYVLLIAAFHPMYVSDRLSDTARPAAWSVALLFGFALGETYAATRAARIRRSAHRVAALEPRDVATYLSPIERIAQVTLAAALAGAAVTLTIDVARTDEPTWARYAMYVCWVWLIAMLGVLVAQRWVLAQVPPLDDARTRIVREYVTASAMQQLHKAGWLAGAMAYITAVGFALGPTPSGGALLAGYAPPLVALAVVAGYRRWRQLPDPVWHFARTTGSAA